MQVDRHTLDRGVPSKGVAPSKSPVALVNLNRQPKSV